jgi:hypothetical protein
LNFAVCRAQDTYVSKDTTVAARLACGAAVDVALALAAKQATHGAALVRPPGHHVRPQPVPLDLLEASIEVNKTPLFDERGIKCDADGLV